jgi:hypothetical protein
MDVMNQLLERIKKLNASDVDGFRGVVNDDTITELGERELLTVYDELLNFVDMNLEWDQRGDNLNVIVHSIITFLFKDNVQAMFTMSSEFKLLFHHINNKTKFLYMMAFTNAPFDPSIFNFLGNYLTIECDTGILTAFIIKSQYMNTIPDTIIQFWLMNSKRYFINDPSCKEYYIGKGGSEYGIQHASDILLSSLIDDLYEDIEYMKLLYPSFDKILSLEKSSDVSFDYDSWVARNWPQKFIPMYYGNTRKISLFKHIPNRQIYDMLINHPHVDSKVKSILKSHFELKRRHIDSFITTMSGKFYKANHSIPDILPDEIKRIILEKTIKASFTEWRHHACTFHGDEEGESVETFNHIINEIFSDPTPKKRKAKGGYTPKRKWVKTEAIETQSNIIMSFTTEQKEAIKILAQKYKNAFKELELPQ